MPLTVNNQNAEAKWGPVLIELSAREVEYFFEELYNLDIFNIKDLQHELQEIADLTIEGAPGDMPVSQIQPKIKLLKLISTTLAASVHVKSP